MREISKKVYKFEELTLEVRQKVAEKFEQQDLEDGTLADSFNMYLEDSIQSTFPNSRLQYQYSLGYSQGDGFNLYGELALEDIPPHVLGRFTAKEQKRIMHYLEYTMPSITIPHNSGHYSYCVAREIDIVDAIVSELENLEYSNIDVELLARFEDYLITEFSNVCNGYEETGYGIFYKTYDLEYVQDMCDGNDYEFYEDGELYQ